MAKDPKQEPVTAPPPEMSVEPLGPPKSYRLYIMLGFVCFVLFELIILWLILPSKSDVQEVAGVNAVDGIVGFDSPDSAPKNLGKQEEMVEKPIGDENTFKMKLPRPTGVSDTLSLVMHVSIRKTDEKDFDTEYQKKMNTIIDEATSILFAMTPEQFSEVGHTTIKQKLKRGINEVLAAPWVQSVIITKPSYEPG